MADGYATVLSKPAESTPFPSPFRNPILKDKVYDVQCAKAIYWNNWQTYNNPFGNYYRNIWIDNRSWARGTQSNLPFAIRPPARNDHTKNPLMNHIDFSSVNEMVKYCDIFCSMLEKNDYDIQATAINPAAAVRKNKIMNDAEAYRQLRPLYQQLDQMSGQKISPDNPIAYNFESSQELEIFFQIGFKLQQELLAEVGTEVVMNESDWPMLRKKGCKDIRDLGHIGIKVEVDLNNRLRAGYLDLINCGWEDYFGEYLAQPSRFWHLCMKTGAQIVAESNFTLTPQDLYIMAKNSEGKFGNPMMPSQMTQAGYFGYINTDNPTYQNFWYDSWKFPVLEAWWEDWEIMKYRAIQDEITGQTISFGPVDFSYQDNTKGMPYEDNGMVKRIKVTESHLHYYRQCKWVVGTEVVYDNGPVRYCPRNPYDIRFALCPIKLYRATGAPYTQRLKSIAKIAQNAWYKLQNEIANSVPHGYSFDIKKANNITSLDGKVIKRQHILELYSETGRVLWSSAAAMDEQGLTNAQRPPVEPIANVDIAAMQRWWDVINQCSARMQQESGLNQFTDASNPNPNTPVGSAKAAIQGTQNAMAQYIDALSKINEELAIHAVGALQQLVRTGPYEGYISSIGASLLKPQGPVNITDDITDFTFGIKIQAKPTLEQREDLKATIRQAYASVATPAEGSPYLADLLWIEQLIDGGTNLKLVALIANYLHKKNMAMMQQQSQAGAQAQAQGQMQMQQQQSQLKLAEEQQMTELRLRENAAKTDDAIRLEQAKASFKGQNQFTSNAQKAEQKKELLEIEKSIAG